MSLRSVNLNLLPVLQALLRERNLSRAGAAVGLTQPAVSAALAKLRVVLNDPLLVRHGRGMSLTMRGQELIAPVDAICASIEAVIASEQFDPSNSSRRFVIASADYAVVTVAPELIRQLRRQAPKMSVHFVDIPHPSLEPHAGEVDLFIVPELLLRENRYPAIRHATLIEDEFVTVVGANHALARKRRLTRDQLLSQDYLMYYPALSSLDGALANAVTGRVEQGRRVIAQIQQFSLLPTLAADTGSAAIVPRRVVAHMQRYLPMRILADGQLPIQLTLALAWYANSENDSAHRWFRKLTLDICARMRGS
ncbi:MAG: LysR family transcriptional regulator [Hyphomonadaceae bacterium]|nr:LysR family transcriptional regulator [Hyphomonadaceae bacterium]